VLQVGEEVVSQFVVLQIEGQPSRLPCLPLIERFGIRVARRSSGTTIKLFEDQVACKPNHGPNEGG
jgi:hypothetical protein